jgi:hypothetical protein
MTSTLATLKRVRFREGSHHIVISKHDCEDACEWMDLSVEELLRESMKAQRAGDARRGWLLSVAAVRRYNRARHEALRETA